jgi:hypothetical protein
MPNVTEWIICMFPLQCHFVFLHVLKGAPWIPQDQGDCRILTHWEQIDNGQQFTATRKFLTVVPITL